MKFRYVLMIFGGILLSLALVGVGVVARYNGRQYAFLEGQQPKRTTVEPDPIGQVGREARYYVIHDKPATVETLAKQELEGSGWDLMKSSPAIFQRRHETILIMSAASYGDPQLTGNIPKPEQANYTVVKVVDPRWRATIRQRIFRWTSHPFRRFFTHMA